MFSLRDQHVLILGLGASGFAMARWCARNGAIVTVVDTRLAPPQLDALKRDVPQATFLCAPFDASLVEGSSVRAVFKSPGLTPIEVAPVLGAAHAMGIWASGELGLFSQALSVLKTSHSYNPKILAVTGTNGKTTVTSLTGQLVSRAGKSVAIAGNIGPTLLDTLSNGLDDDKLPEVWVIELSSFQLDQANGFEPTAATVLNITQDHLDWHGSMQDYTCAKARIFGESALMVLNRDDAGVMALLPAPVKGRTPRHWVGFGGDMPQRPGDFGIEQVNGMVWLVRALEADETLKKRKGVEEEVHFQRLMPADALRIRGRHNALNALAALALASAGIRRWK
jgi:UDP-N-acetylmuramoylalanine--D-glutamate ligase